jgi:hypothetical protein
MTIDRGGASPVVSIRVPGRVWVGPLAYGGVWLLFAVLWSMIDQPFFALSWLTLGCVMVVTALWSRTFGVDLTRGCAIVRGFRRRVVPWHEVQAVVHHRRQGAWGVRLILESGKPVMLRAPTTYCGLGVAGYERDFDQIGQWWLACRGESWRPVCPEAPPLPVER